MKDLFVNIDFKKMADPYRNFVREKAIKKGTKIVYQINNILFEENPLTNEKKVLKNYPLP